MEDTEDRLTVLTGPDAQAAGQWVSQFLATARNWPQDQLRVKRPDVMNMTAAQIQQELDRFNSQRDALAKFAGSLPTRPIDPVQSAERDQRQSTIAEPTGRQPLACRRHRPTAHRGHASNQPNRPHRFHRSPFQLHLGGPAYTISPGMPIPAGNRSAHRIGNPQLRGSNYGFVFAATDAGSGS